MPLKEAIKNVKTATKLNSDDKNKLIDSQLTSRVQGLSPQQAISYIQSVPGLDDADRQQLISPIKAAVQAKLANVRPSQTLVSDPSGNTQIVDNGSVQTFLQRNPGYYMVGQGTRQSTPEGTYIK